MVMLFSVWIHIHRQSRAICCTVMVFSLHYTASGTFFSTFLSREGVGYLSKILVLSLTLWSQCILW